MKGASDSILDAIGNTALVRLNRVAAEVSSNIFVKCEYLNPAGSMKDRMTLNLVNQAEARGELKPGGTIIEATSGNTGAALAMIGAVRGYECIFVMPDKMSQEKVAGLRAYGARVVMCPTAVEPEDPRSYYSVAKKLVEETPNSFYANQYHNMDNPGGHYQSTGPELYGQTQGDMDVFVAGMGTGGTISGTGKYLKEKQPDVTLVGVDPVGSLYYDFVKTGRITKPFTYLVEGIGEDFFPSTIDLSLIDEIVRVDDRECFMMARDLVRQEGLFVGGSSGAAVAGAIKYAKKLSEPKNIVVLLCDGASKYLSKIFNDDWMRENGFLADVPGLGTVKDLLHKKGESVVSAAPGDSLRDVVGRMKQHGVSQLPVVDDGQIRGAVAEVDVLRSLVSGEHTLASDVGAVIQSDYATVTPDTKLELVQDMLTGVRMAVVVEQGVMKGVITKIDLIDHLARRASIPPGSV